MFFVSFEQEEVWVLVNLSFHNVFISIINSSIQSSSLAENSKYNLQFYLLEWAKKKKH